MFTKYCIFIIGFLFCLTVHPFVNSAQARNKNREIISDGMLSAQVKDGFRCSPYVDLIVISPSLKYFAKDTRSVEKFVKAARSKLEAECGQVLGMKIFGVVNDSRVYEATVNKKSGWKLIPAYPDRFKYQARINLKSRESRAPKPVLFPVKSWNSQETLSKQRDGFSIALFKSTGPKAQPEDFRLVADLNNRDGARTHLSFTGNGYTSCAEVMSIKASAFSHLLDFDEFRKTLKGHDLPPEIIDGYYLIRDVLVGQCPDLKVLRVSFETMSGNSFELKLKYSGTMTADSGWDLLDGTVETAYDSTRKIQIKTRDVFSVAGIDYQGYCETAPLLPLKPVYYNKSESALAKSLTLTDYKFNAKTVAKLYQKECPKVKDIRFSTTPMPENYICMKNGPCYLTWSADKPDDIDSSQMELKPMLRNYNDVIKAFATADKKILDEYKAFVRLFHNDWMEVYSEECRSHIIDPKGFSVQSFEVRYNPDGFVESAEKVGVTQEIYVAEKYANRFELFYELNKTWGTALLLNHMTDSGTVAASPRMVKRAISHFINNRNQLTEFMEGSCMSAEVQTIYEDLGRYYTGKPLKTIDIDNGSSLKRRGTDQGTPAVDQAITWDFPDEAKTAPAFARAGKAMDLKKEINPGPAKPSVSDRSLSGTVDKPTKKLINSENSFEESFPADLVLSPPVTDFLAARYYPDLLTQRMLEAMLSSRWTYERSQQKPLGGRFFHSGTRPEYADIQGLTERFRNWLISRAKALPKEMIVEVPLQYGQNTMRVNDNCFKLIMPKNASQKISQADKEKAKKKIRKCEDQKLRLEQHFKSCENARNDLEQAKQKLSRAMASGCPQNNSTDSPEGPCKLPDNLNMTNIKAEMMKCMTSTCGTPSGTTDMLAYQKCVMAVSEQFQNEFHRQMGQNSRSKTAQNKNICQAAEKEVQTNEQLLAQYRCDSMPQNQKLPECGSTGAAEQPDYMQIERIDLSPLKNCTANVSAYNRKFRSSAELLPNARPYTDTDFDFVLLVNKLMLPYSSPVSLKGQSTTINARIKLTVKDVEKSINRNGQLGLKAEVNDIEFKE